MYVIVKGRVKIARSSLDGKERTLVLLGPGDFFGELVLPREEFRAFLLEQPQVAMELLVVLSRRIRRTSQIVHDAAFFDVRGRLARVLLELAKAEGKPDAGGALVCPHLTQGELAGMVGVTRESINKWLRTLERHGTVAQRRGRLVLLEPERLRDEIA